MLPALILLFPLLGHARGPGSLTNALVAPPVDEEVCFSPEEKCDAKLVKFVETAKASLDVAIYDINLDNLVHEILVLSKKIPVRVIVDRRQAKGHHSLVNTLIQGGVNLRYGHQRGIMHNKFTIVDGRMIETGSFNHTNHASRANNENQVYLASPKIVSRYQRRFEEIWAKGDPAN
jgi:phosphatidylserine/phosphatidylglycerophosphate/cardiolipin synthase-like enzyme